MKGRIATLVVVLAVVLLGAACAGELTVGAPTPAIRPEIVTFQLREVTPEDGVITLWTSEKLEELLKYYGKDDPAYENRRTVLVRYGGRDTPVLLHTRWPVDQRVSVRPLGVEYFPEGQRVVYTTGHMTDGSDWRELELHLTEVPEGEFTGGVSFSKVNLPGGHTVIFSDWTVDFCGRDEVCLQVVSVMLFGPPPSS